jgi:outer membrane lipoprotein-sorting protein
MISRPMNRGIALAALLLLVAAPRATLAVAPASPPISSEDLALAQKAVDYLQALTSAQARFVQTDPRGAVSQGEFWLQRPGKARFQYDPPSGMVIASDGRRVSVLNPRLKTFQSYPLGLTPLSVILGREIRLGHGVEVSSVARKPGGFSVVARSGRKNEQGRIVLDFTDAPLALTGWTITNAQGGETTVRLVGLHPAGGFDPHLFDLPSPPLTPEHIG